MANKITPDQITTMIKLYQELKTYSAVAKQMGISAATVSRYIKENKSIQTYSTSLQPQPIEEISKDSILSFANITEEEKQSYDKWLKEFNR